MPESAEDAYRKQVGHDPPAFPDGRPGKWEFEYQGKPDERKMLREQYVRLADDEDGPPQAETLF